MGLAYAIVGIWYWLASLVLAVRAMRSVRALRDLHPPEPPSWPKVSLIIPACNEAATIERAVRSRLKDGYSNFEIILIDDRSTDATGAIVDQLAAADPRIRPLHIRELPEGWLGKVHALHRGSELASGEWLLFTDADVHQQPGTLARCIAYALQRNLDHVAVLPELWSATFFLDVMIATFLRLLCVIGRLWAIENPRSRAAPGIGAFNLVRRTALDRTPGFEWLRLEVVDDLALGQMLKQAGARGALLGGLGFIGLRWYHSVGDMAWGAEKSALSGLNRYSFLRMLLTTLILVALDWAPFLALVLTNSALVRWLGACGVACAVICQVWLARWAQRPLLAAMLAPLGTLLMAYISIRGGLLAVWRGGVTWRGTLYPLDVLRRGTRLRVF